MHAVTHVRWRAPIVALAMLLGAGLALLGSERAGADTVDVKRYNVLFAGAAGEDGFTITGGREAALATVAAAGGTIVTDLSAQIGAVAAVRKPDVRR